MRARFLIAALLLVTGMAPGQTTRRREAPPPADAASPESIVKIGGKVASNTPSRTVSLFESTTWTRPEAPVAVAAVSVPPAA